MLRRKVTLFGALGIAILTTGCGGGSTATTVDSGTREDTFGPVTTRSVGGVSEPVIFSGAKSTVTGIYGASFLNITVNLPAASSESDSFWDFEAPIAMSQEFRGGYYNFSSGKLVVPNSEPTGFAGPTSTSFTNNGQAILATEPDSTSNLQIASVPIDGSPTTFLTSGGTYKFDPHQSPTTGQICYSSNNDIFVMNSNGTGVVQLTNTPGITERMPRFSPDGTKIGYLRDNALWEMNANGTSPTYLYGGMQVNGHDYHPTEKASVVCGSIATVSYLVLLSRQSLNIRILEQANSPVSHQGATFGPFGSQVATRRFDGTNSALCTYDIATKARTTHFTLPESTQLGDWGPLPRKKFFVNPTGATLHTNAAGFLFGQDGKRFKSLLAFDAQTRNTVDIDAHSASSTSTNYTATITAADKITMLRYANGMTAPRVTVVDPASTATHVQGALVSFEAETGEVATVITFTRSRDSLKPTVTKAGDRLQFNGEFLAAYDASGKVVKAKPTNVSMDEKTGAVSFR